MVEELFDQFVSYLETQELIFNQGVLVDASFTVAPRQGNTREANNRQKSKIRARVEHVFGFMEQSMNGLALKSVGIIRTTGIIGLINLTYNLFRYEQIKRLKIT